MYVTPTYRARPTRRKMAWDLMWQKQADPSSPHSITWKSCGSRQESSPAPDSLIPGLTQIYADWWWGNKELIVKRNKLVSPERLGMIQEATCRGTEVNKKGRQILHARGCQCWYKGKRKIFWSYVKSREKEASGVAPLLKTDCKIIFQPRLRFLMNSFIPSTHNIPGKGPSPFVSLHEISINSNDVEKLLTDLKPL